MRDHPDYPAYLPRSSQRCYARLQGAYVCSVQASQSEAHHIANMSNLVQTIPELHPQGGNFPALLSDLRTGDFLPYLPLLPPASLARICAIDLALRLRD